MSIRQMLSPSEQQQLSQSDRSYLKRQLAEHTALNQLLNRPINQHLLHELQCILDSKSLPRQKPGQFVRGQISRLSDGIKRPCIVRKMTEEEMIRYGVVYEEVRQS